MKNITSILLLVVLATPHLMRLGIVLQWKANQEYIVANYCENRAKPALKCNGKCQLKKQLAKVETESPVSPASSQKLPPVKSFEFSPFLMPESFVPKFDPFQFDGSGSTFPELTPGYRFTFINAFFQPPDRQV